MTLSSYQVRALEMLSREPANSKDIARHCGVKSGQTMLQSLCSQGLIAYVGGPGIVVGRGKWRITERGRTVYAETMDRN